MSSPLDRPSILKHLTTPNGTDQLIKLATSLGTALAAVVVVAMFLYFIDRGKTRVEAMHAEAVSMFRELVQNQRDLKNQLDRIEAAIKR